jgi:aminoglycoside phosphotransferase (APT) family kinase protein
MTEHADTLERYLNHRLGDAQSASVTPMTGGGSCEIFAIERGSERWVLRRAPRHASSATAHDVLREFRILDAIKETPVPIANPILSCDDPEVFGSPFYIMERIDGVPIRASLPAAWAAAPETHGRALDQHIDALVAIHAVDWKACGLGGLAHTESYLQRQIGRWLRQLDSYESRELPLARSLAEWMQDHRPAEQAPSLFHGDYKLDNVLYAQTAPPHLLAVVDWEMAGIGDPLVDLAWTLIFHPGPEGTMHLGTSKEPVFAQEGLPSRATLIERYGRLSGRDTSAINWYDIFSRWKLAIALEGSYAKFLQGRSDKPIHEYFGGQADLLLSSAQSIVERGAAVEEGRA